MDISKYKILGGAMSWISDPTLVAALSNAGALGVLATGAMEAHHLDKAIREIKLKTDRDFGVNLIGLSPYYDQLLEVCADHQVKAIILAAMIPKKDRIQRIKKMGAKVLGFATSLRIAQGLISNGLDALILEGNEAGGHVGPISTSVLVQEILFNVKNFPIFVAGGVGHGKMIKHYIGMGAIGCQLGSRFVCAKESPMHSATKQFYISKSAKDTMVVSAIDPMFNVIPVRVIKNKAVEEFYAKQREAIGLMSKGELDAHEAQLYIENFWSGSLKRGVLEGDLEYGSLMAGQSISCVTKEETAQEIMDELYSQIDQID